MARILVADDDDLILGMNTHVLKALGHTVGTAVNGTELYTQLRTGAYDLFVSDFNMPGMTGLEAVLKARQDKVFIPGVFASGDDFNSLLGHAANATNIPIGTLEVGPLNREITRKLGVAILRKPFALTDLKSAVELVSALRYDSANGTYQ